MTSKQTSTEGLSDEQICELLMGGAPKTATELPAEADALKSALTSYRMETLRWAERRSAAMPSLLPAARRNGVWAAVPQWSLAAVAVITVAIGVAHLNNASQEDAAAESPAAIKRTVDAAATPEQIADDNALLGSIDAAVNAGTGLPVKALGLELAPTAGRADGSMN